MPKSEYSSFFSVTADTAALGLKIYPHLAESFYGTSILLMAITG
jgi:hypothetical protein